MSLMKMPVKLCIQPRFLNENACVNVCMHTIYQLECSWSFIITPVINLRALKKCTCLQPNGLSIHSIASHFIILHLSCVCDPLIKFNPSGTRSPILKGITVQSGTGFVVLFTSSCDTINHDPLGNPSIKCYATYTSPQPGVTYKVIFKTLKSTTVQKLNHRMALVKPAHPSPWLPRMSISSYSIQLQLIRCSNSDPSRTWLITMSHTLYQSILQIKKRA